MMDKQTYDICIIGGGVNGCGIARDAAGRGYKVLVLEKGDLASATSSASTKLIHGGLRYLEHFEFGLVRKSLKEREVLYNLAPHIIWPMEFILPHARHLRPLWLIRLGLYLYDYLGGKSSFKKSYKTILNNKLFKQNFKSGIAYSDCWVEDARLVILNAMDAQMRGAKIMRDSECVSIGKDNDVWTIRTKEGAYQAQMIVNAAGPWASKIISGVDALPERPLRLVKGSHIIVPKIHKGDESYILQNEDGRIVFVIPYEGDYSLIGTTDEDVGNNPNQEIKISDNEINYLIDVVKQYFKVKISIKDIVSTYAGVRPLMDDEDGDASKASRDYMLDMQSSDGMPFLSVLGGKLTTYRVLAEEAVDKIDRVFHKKSNHWTRHEKLPGGDIPDNDFERFVTEQAADFPFLSKSLIRRYARAYGTCMNIILDGVRSLDDMGADIGGGVYGRELDYLRAYEFAKTGEDVLWRRSKLGLHLDRASIAAVTQYMEDHA
jgi:glycerol-3-phosphate dehydrogenase